MGEIKKLLALDELEPRTITATGIWTDLCEDVHLHYRNNRFDFSEAEWSHFRAAINHLGMAVEYVAEKEKFREGDPNFLVQQMYNTPLRSDSEYYPNRLSIELQRDNTVHFHYRDLRLHFSNSEFVTIATAFHRAFLEYRALKPFPYKVDKYTRFDDVPLELIQPWDEGHRPMAIDEEHRKGIEFVKGLISDGKKIRPILVNCEGQRLDGFKRYMAHKELGLKTINIIVDPNGLMGGQHNQCFVEDENA